MASSIDVRSASAAANGIEAVFSVRTDVDPPATKDDLVSDFVVVVRVPEGVGIDAVVRVPSCDAVADGPTGIPTVAGGRDVLLLPPSCL